MLARAKESATAASVTAAAAAKAGAEKALAGAEQAKASASAATKASLDAMRRRRVATLSEAEVAAVRALFNAADTLGRGWIDRLELRKALLNPATQPRCTRHHRRYVVADRGEGCRCRCSCSISVMVR